MAEISQNIKYVKLDDGVSFELVRTNPKLTTNTKLMYNGKDMYMESYASSPLLNTARYKNARVRPSSTYNIDIAGFLTGSGSRAYDVYQNFSDTVISDSYDNQFENMYWCGAEYIESSFYSEEIGFVAPLYLREKLPNYFLIFRLDTPSNYNLNVDKDGNTLDPTFDFKTDILDKAVLIKSFDLREGSVLGNYIHNYVNQEGFEFDKSMFVNFSNGEVTYYGINKTNGILEKKVENFENELLKNDNPILTTDKWFTEGFERNNLIFPYIMNIEYLFDDRNFVHGGRETYDFARYIGVYCNNIEFGEFLDLEELVKLGYTQDNAIYYFEDNNNNLHRYSNNEDGLKIDGKDSTLFDQRLVSGFEKERDTGYAEPLDVYDGFINRAQYGFEILKPLEPGDWIGIEYNGHVECYFADNKTIDAGVKRDMFIGEYSDFRFSVNENSSLNAIAESLVKCVNHNINSKFEAKCSDNVVAFYAKREGKEYNGSENGGAKMLMEASLLYNKKISMPISDTIKHIDERDCPVEDISDSDLVYPAVEFDENGNVINVEKSSFGDYYKDYFYGACNVEVNVRMDTYKNAFKIYADDYVIFDTKRYLKTNNGNGRRIVANMVYINGEGKIDPKYRLVIVDDVPKGHIGDVGYDVSVSSTFYVEILDPFKSNHGIFSWFPIKDFDFDINNSTYGQYSAFVDECKSLSKKIIYRKLHHLEDTYADSDSRSTQEDTAYGIEELAKSPFFDDFGKSLESEYDYYLEQIHPDLCLLSKSSPYISKWGYYDDQKDSCENTYRLNVSKVFGVSNLSANIYLRSCNEDEYTHSMPYFITLDTPNYYKNYQYIECDEVYANHTGIKKDDQYMMSDDMGDSDISEEIVDSGYFKTFSDCVYYWVDDVFKRTDVDMFTRFFSGKKYGKRFDKKYSRILCGDKFHNPSTLFRGVKFEIVRQYNGSDAITSEYNGYRFSFIYVPVMLDSMIFNSTVHFVKNDTFKFIVGIVFVNTMLGTLGHNIFDGDINYFNKAFLYSSCKDIIRAENTNDYGYDLTLTDSNNNDRQFINIYNEVWKDNYDLNNPSNIFHIWIWDNKQIIITKKRNTSSFSKIVDVIGEFEMPKGINIEYALRNAIKPQTRYTLFERPESDDNFKVTWDRYYEEYDANIYGYKTFEYYGSVLCELGIPNVEFKNLVLVDVCDINWQYYNNQYFGGYEVDVSKLHINSESLQNILINMDDVDSIISIKFYNVDGNDGVNTIFNRLNGEFINGEDNVKIEVDIESGTIMIKAEDETKGSIDTRLEVIGYYGEIIENLRVDILIKDKYDERFESLCFKNYFSVFNQLSMYNIAEYINNNRNVKYYSTKEDNKFKVKVIEPDSIEVVDKYEVVPISVTQNNRSVLGSVEIREKSDVDRIGIKVINRYSGYYNPIFNDILYYDDYTYTKSVGRLKNAVKFEMPYSNTNIDCDYNDGYGEFGVIKNMYYHKTNIYRSDKILTSEKHVYPAINEYALDYRDYNIFSSSWDENYFISQDDLNTRSICNGIGSMKDGLCMFGSKYLNLPDAIFIDTFAKGKIWDEQLVTGVRDNTDTEVMYKEINDRTVRYQLFIEKRLKRYLKEMLMGIFSKYINKNYSFGNKGTIDDDVEEYVEKNLLKLYKVDKVYMYVRGERVSTNNRLIENDYLKYISISNETKIKNGFPTEYVNGSLVLLDSAFTMSKVNEFDRCITYNLTTGLKESFGFAVSIKRK